MVSRIAVLIGMLICTLHILISHRCYYMYQKVSRAHKGEAFFIQQQIYDVVAQHGRNGNDRRGNTYEARSLGLCGGLVICFCRRQQYCGGGRGRAEDSGRWH